jgi:membrane-bound serine protease (ClpP class)
MFAEALWILFAVVLLILCAVLLVFEIFIPSLGLLTATALLCLAGGIYLFFQISTTVGWVGVWTAVVLELKKVEQAMGGIPNQEHLESLMGQSGIVLTPLRPVGMCELDGKKIVCVADTGYIEKQTQVKVIHVEGNKITVRKLEID